MIKFDVATSTEQLEQILALQRRYHASVLSRDTQDREGFVFARHSMPLLRCMAAELPQAIAVEAGAVVGYCLAMSPRLRHALPELTPMFDQFDQCTYRAHPLSSYRFFVGGQVCVDRAYRGRGLLAKLYECIRATAPGNYELCVTEIAARNKVSLRAHKRAGFEELLTYSDRHERWVIVAWNLSRSIDSVSPFRRT